VASSKGPRSTLPRLKKEGTTRCSPAAPSSGEKDSVVDHLPTIASAIHHHPHHRQPRTPITCRLVAADTDEEGSNQPPPEIPTRRGAHPPP
ncbi:hypothetical protein Dimus_006012, partial [Dionaea muscipula]